MAVETRALARDFLALHEGVQVAAEFLAGVFRHASANSHGEMIAAREGPKIAFKLLQKFHANPLGLRRHKITERHFQVVARERARAREKDKAGDTLPPALLAQP